MVYIYKKMVGGKLYYYLRLSKRVNGKVVTKDIAYLGSDPSKIRPKLDKLPAKYKKDIRKTYRNIDRFIYSDHYLKKVQELKPKEDPFLERKSLENIEAIKLHFNKRFLKLDDKTKKDVYETFLVDFAYNTTSLEGNTITLKEADRLLTENLTPKDRTPREIFDLQNTQKVFSYLLEEKPSLNEKLVIDVHDMLLKNIDDRKGYRIHDIRVLGSRFKATPYSYISTDMGLLFKWYNKHKSKLHPFVLAGVFHQKFEKIHPFADGNGRTGRMILNYMLMNERCPPLIIRKINRAKYLNALSSADKSGLTEAEPKNFQKLLGYLAFELNASYWNNFMV